MKIIAYIRVSTQKQGRSGLGLEAQQHAVQAFARSVRGNIVATFTEVETGKRANRPELSKAIEAARKAGATLVIAKLDRLARNVEFTAALMNSGIEFIACDCPHATPLTIHILAAVAEDEARRISERTTAALPAAKRRGVKLGSMTKARQRQGASANGLAATAHAAEIRPLAEKKRKAGKTLQEIADWLSGRGLRTRYGKQWTPTAVMRMLAC
jgi:DNA invertase Pin-like site-specific DNA recombinase